MKVWSLEDFVGFLGDLAILLLADLIAQIATCDLHVAQGLLHDGIKIIDLRILTFDVVAEYLFLWQGGGLWTISHIILMDTLH